MWSRLQINMTTESVWNEAVVLFVCTIHCIAIVQPSRMWLRFTDVIFFKQSVKALIIENRNGKRQGECQGTDTRKRKRKKDKPL